MFVSEVEFMLHKKQLNRIIRIQELKLKLLEKEIKINKIDTRIQLTAMAAILKPSEMSDTEEEYDMYIEMLCENCLTEILDKKITAIKPKKIE